MTPEDIAAGLTDVQKATVITVGRAGSGGLWIHSGAEGYNAFSCAIMTRRGLGIFQAGHDDDGTPRSYHVALTPLGLEVHAILQRKDQ